MKQQQRVAPGLAVGDEVVLVHQPPRAPRETVEGMLGASIAPDGRIDSIIVSGDGWAVHVDPVNVMFVGRADDPHRIIITSTGAAGRVD